MSVSFTPGKSAFSRVFLIEGRSGPANAPQYQTCMRAGSFDQSFGDVEPIKVPSSARYGEFDEIGEILGEVERGSSSLIGQYAADLRSEIFRLAKQRCPVDVQIHFGACTDPRQFNRFTKALIWENTRLSSYSTDDLGAMQDGDNAAITETGDLSIKEAYEVLQLTVEARATDVVHNEVTDAVLCDLQACYDECGDESDGCQKIYVLHGGILGSPGTPPDVAWTDDGGATWSNDEIYTLTSSEEATALACVGDYLIVISQDTDSAHYKERDDVLDGVVGSWTEDDTGFVSSPLDIWSVGALAFIVGETGYIYSYEIAGEGATVLDAGVITSEDLQAVHAIDEEHAVAVGENGVVVYTTNGVSWQQTDADPTAEHLHAVWMRSEAEWWVGDAAGGLFYTLDSGATWTEKTLPGASVNLIMDIQFPKSSVGYVVGRAGTAGAMWRTYNGGYSWVRMPEGTGTLAGSSTQLNALASCPDDVNFVVAGGAAGSDLGVVLVGEI
jgi:photosystem II stability/assembly factor-like uncharacterized protein